MLLCFTTHFITDLHAQLQSFPAFLPVFRRKEPVIMKQSVLTLMSMEKTTFILYFDIKDSRHELYEFLTHDKNPQ